MNEKRSALSKISLILVLEILFAGIYVSLTRGLFVIYLASIGYSVSGISLVTLLSALATIFSGALLYKRSTFIIKKIKIKLIIFHVFERITWVLIILTSNILLISLLYSMQLIFSFLINTFISFIIYGSFTEDLIKDVTAKRAAANGVSSVMGFALGTLMLALLSPENKFGYIFFMGASLGLISTFLVSLLDLSHLEEKKFPEIVEEPEKIFSSSLFSIILLSSGNLMGIAWTPYLMRYLGGPDFLASLINLAQMLSSTVASLFWRRKAFEELRIGLLLNSFGPILVLATPFPIMHIVISVYTSFTYAGASFISSFLFARYNRWFGAVRSGILLTIFNSLAQVVASLTGLLIGENFIAIFLIASVAKFAATFLALFIIPEVAVISEDAARIYSQILYNTGLSGYHASIELSKETILTALRLLALLSAIVILYIIYYILWVLISWGRI